MWVHAHLSIEIGAVSQSRRHTDWDSAVAGNRLQFRMRFDMTNRMSNRADVNGDKAQ